MSFNLTVSPSPEFTGMATAFLVLFALGFLLLFAGQGGLFVLLAVQHLRSNKAARKPCKEEADKCLCEVS
jgi:hypothetical protein